MILKFLHSRGSGGWAGDIIRSEKIENDMNSTHTKIKFPIFFNFFFMMDIKKFLDWESGLEGEFFYFLLFHQCNNISSFIVVYIYIWHIVTVCYVLMCFSLPLKSTLLATKNVSPPIVFDLGVVMQSKKNTFFFNKKPV